MKIILKLIYSIRVHYAVILGFFLLFLSVAVSAQPKDFLAETNKLLSRMSPESPELKTVKDNVANPEISAKKLLKYYKTRTSVKHPAQNSEVEEITERDLKWANDALQHIFVGQPAYPSHFCGEDIDWGSSPVPDNEWVWQLNRMYFWNAMAKIYSHTHQEKYAGEWSKQLIHWVKNNPRNDEHKYAWRSIETGIRGYNWTNLFYHFIYSEHFTEETLVYFLNSLYEHAEFLMTVYRSKSNWGLMEAEGLAFIAITFPEFENAEKWKTEAFRRLNNEINLQVYPDGHQRELAIGYHIGCIRWFYRTYELAKLNGLENAFSDFYLKMIEKMCEVPLKIGLPDGTNVQFGDAWRGEPNQHNKQFAEWAEMFGRDDFLYLATDGQQGMAPKETAFALPQSGIYSMRSGWDENDICLVLKCGPDGGGHCQPDNGTFVLYAGGRNLMPDAGSYIYSGNPDWRRWFRQTKIHQTLTLNEEDTKYEPRLIKWQTGQNMDFLVVENAGYDNLTHRRSVIFIDKKYFVIIDDAIGSGTGNIDIHFQLGPGTAMYSQDNFTFNSYFTEGWNVFVKSKKQKGLELSEEDGWVSFEYTKKVTRPAFRYRIKKKKPGKQVQFVSLLIPYKNILPKIEIQKVKQTANGTELIILENDEIRTIKYEL